MSRTRSARMGASLGTTLERRRNTAVRNGDYTTKEIRLRKQCVLATTCLWRVGVTITFCLSLLPQGVLCLPSYFGYSASGLQVKTSFRFRRFPRAVPRTLITQFALF